MTDTPIVARRRVEAGEIVVRHHPARVRGARPAPILALVHGMADSSNGWRALMPALGSYDVWTFDMPWSGVGGPRWAAARRAAAWWSLALETCPVAPDLIVGHSFAGTMLVDWALGDAAIDPRLLLLAPVFVADVATIDWDYIDRFARSVPAQLQASLDARMAERFSITVTAAMARKLADGLMPGGMLELFSMVDRLSDAPKAALVGRVEVLVGDGDSVMARTGAAALARQCGTQARAIAGCGHGIMTSHPHVVAAAIEAVFDPALQVAA